VRRDGTPREGTGREGGETGNWDGGWIDGREGDLFEGVDLPALTVAYTLSTNCSS